MKPLATLEDKLVAAGFDRPEAEPERNDEGDILRDVAEILSHNAFGANRVRLTCGHEGYTFGTHRAGCPKCTAEIGG